MITALLVPRRVRWAIGHRQFEYPVQAVRVPSVTNARTVQEVPGGYIEATFTIPSEHAQETPDAALREGVIVWLYDASEPIFYGVLRRATPTTNGDVDVALDGMWRLLADTQMREVWADGDLSKLSPSPGNIGAAQIQTTSLGNLRITLPEGTKVRAGDRATVDYYLFGEASGTRDGKGIDGFDIHISGGSYYASTVMSFQVWGRFNVSDDFGNHLWTTDAAQPPIDHQENAGSWPSPAGYRVIRLGLYINTDFTLTADRDVAISRFRVSTAARELGMSPTNLPTTTTIIKNLWRQSSGLLDLHPYLVEPAYAESTSLGRLITGNAATTVDKRSAALAAQQKPVDGIAFTEWTTPLEILEALNAIDGFIIGMWTPARRYPLGSVMAATGMTTYQGWHWAPPELIHQAWSDLSDPDYYVRLGAGAAWEPDEQAETTCSAVYVNYQTLSGRQLSEYVEDATQMNYLYQQGQHKAVEWTITPPVSRDTALALANRYLAMHRQPSITGTLTIYGDRRGAVESSLGVPLAKLSTLRPGVIRIPDARRAHAGRITRIEWSARTDSQPETAVLSVNAPQSQNLDRYLAKLARRAERSRTR